MSQSLIGRDAEFEVLRQRWIDLISGRRSVVASSPAFRASLNSLDDACDEIIGLAASETREMRVFEDKTLRNEAEMTDSFVRLQTLSKAWVTPGSRFHQSVYVRNFVLTALADIHAFAYHPGATSTGNWWEWEIGSAKAFADVLTVFRDHISEADLSDYCAAIDYFVPDPWQQQGGIQSTGANRVDLCQAVIVRSLLTGDNARLRRAVAGLPETWDFVDSGDGFHRDGSYVQHMSVAYTGTYGVVLLQGLSLLFALLAGDAEDFADDSRAKLDDAVEGSYAPFIWRGQMMDAVRGRAISREKERSTTFGDDAIEAILRLATTAQPERAARWRALCKGWIEDARSAAWRHDILTDASVVRTALVHDVMTSDLRPARPEQSSRIYSGMDRVVHRGRGGGWALSIAMNSRRISWYECGNGENNLGAQTSSGMTYLYVDGDEGHFDDEFWSTSDLDAPPGTTVDLESLPAKVEGEWGAGRPPNEWTGGVALGGWGLAGHHMIAPGGSGLTARKTWLVGPDHIACLGSDVVFRADALVAEAHSAADAPRRMARTIVEHRSTGRGRKTLTVDDRPVVGSVSHSSPEWAHLEGVAGYLFLGTAQVGASNQARSGSWSRVDVAGSDAIHTRQYATIEIRHPIGETGEYAYVILPRASVQDTKSAAAAQPFAVIANRPDVQALSAGDITAVNFWRATCVAGIAADRVASIIVRQSNLWVDIAVADPTHDGENITIDFTDRVFASVEGDRVQLVRLGTGSRVIVDVSAQAGRPVQFRLTREKADEVGTGGSPSR